MGVRYIETYDIPGTPQLGIEDHEDGRPDKEHFFADEYRKGKAKRFRCWWNGGGIGNVSTIQRARGTVHSWAVQNLTEKRDKLRAELREVEQSLAKLGDDTFNLGIFRADK